MAKGRRPAPTALKIASAVRKSRIAKAEPRASGVPDAPDHLSDAARRSWFHVVPMLQGMGVLGKADGLALERLCECHAEILTLQDELKSGRVQTVTTKAGGSFERQRPQVGMLQDADRRFKSYLVEFGLTPAARSKVNAVEQQETSDEDRYFGKQAG